MYSIIETICSIRSQFIWLGNLKQLNWDIIWYYRFLLSTKACGSKTQNVPDSELWLSIPFEVDSNFKIILTLCPLVFVSKPQQLRPTLHTSIDKLYSFYYNSNSKFLFVTELTELLYLTGVKPTFTLSRISHKVTNGQSNTITAKFKE